MIDVIRRGLTVVGTSALLCGVVATGTGCGALKAAANPKVAWAMNDPAPMSVVVRRADVAEKTAQNVDRIMTDTPIPEDGAWLNKVAPEQEESKNQLVELRKNDLYLTNVKIVAAEVWAKNLSALEPKDKKAAAPAATAKKADPAKDKKDAVAAAPAPAADPAPAAPAAPAADEPAPAPEPAAKPGKGKKGQKVAKAPKQPKGAKGKKPAKDATAAAPAPAADPAPVAAKEAAPAKEPVSTTTTTAATAPAATTSTAKYTSILAAIDKDLGDEWAKVMEKKKAMGDLKGQIAVLEAANDEKGISDADKKSNKAKIDELDKQVDALDKEASTLQKAFVPKAKEAAKKTPQDVREKVGPVLVNLQKAVDDANISNGAAAVRYAFAATTLLDSAQTMAKIYIADVIEEKTGKRPTTQGLQPGVTMEGGKVAVTINGLSSSDMGKISMGELSSEVASRTTAWVKHAMGLLGTIASTKEILSFEDDVLSALLDGFKGAGYAPPQPATIPEAPPAAAQPGAAQPKS
jgi:hypothetical protein